MRGGRTCWRLASCQRTTRYRISLRTSTLKTVPARSALPTSSRFQLYSGTRKSAPAPHTGPSFSPWDGFISRVLWH